jgi:hypothetical protein
VAAGGIEAEPPLPVTGSVGLDIPVERMWDAFADVPGWRRWNRSFARSWVRGGELRKGATIVLVFRPLRRAYPYRLPGTAELVEVDPCRAVAWEVRAPGFHALHRYFFEDLGEGRCRFGSWEVAEGAVYRATRRFWVAHFDFVCRESLAGARRLAGSP